MYFPKGFIYDLGSKSEICPVFVYGYCGPGSFRVSGERVIKTIYQDFKLSFFRRVIGFWLLFIIEPKSYPVIVRTATAREWCK